MRSKKSYRSDQIRQRSYYSAENRKRQIGTQSRDKRQRKISKKARRGGAVKGAKNRLRQFRQASILAVALTGFLLLLFNVDEDGYSQGIDTNNIEETNADTVGKRSGEVQIVEEEITQAAKKEAIYTLTNIWQNFYANLPKILVAIGTFMLAWLFVLLMKLVLRKTIGKWKSSEAIVTLTSIAMWLIAIGIAVSVLAGDIRALVGSLGLVGLALSWSLQTPIESFTAWLQNSFKGYYRVGDRISVGEVFGDVYEIDYFTTTVWEIGAPYRQGFVQAEQATGRLVTFPNNEILSGTVVNLTRDFPYVWDELAIAVANESDLHLAMKVVDDVASNLLKDYMEAPAREYRMILKRANLDYKVADHPEVYLSTTESWTDIVVRYLVRARERRLWKSELVLKISDALNKKEYKGKIISVYPRQQVQFIDTDGIPVDVRKSRSSK